MFKFNHMLTNSEGLIDLSLVYSSSRWMGRREEMEEEDEACFMGVMESNERGGTSTEGQELRGLPYMTSAQKK